MRTTSARVLYRPQTPALRYLPEGPWACGPQQFCWVAIQHGPHARQGSINVYDASCGENVSHAAPGRPGFAAPTDRSGVFLAGCEREIGLLDTRSGEWRVMTAAVDQDVEGTIINDGLVFDEGVVFGTKDLTFSEPKAGLYLWRARDRALVRLRDDQICSNGKILHRHPGGGWTLLDIDSPTRRVVQYRLDVDAGRLGEPETVVDLAAEPGFPDGMARTPDGGSVIIAMFDPGEGTHGEARQHRIVDGRLEARWTLEDSPQVTCARLVSLGGQVRLLLTTATENMTPEREARCQHAGSLFVADTGFTAAPATPVFPVASAF